MRHRENRIRLIAPDIAPKSATTPKAKPPGDHIPLGGLVFTSTVEPFGRAPGPTSIPGMRISGSQPRPLANSRWRFFLTGSDHECSDYKSFNLAGSARYIGSITFRDQLDWPGAARVLAAIDFRRSECTTTNAPVKIRASVAPKLPGSMQLIQVPIIAGASYMAAISFFPSPRWSANRESQSSIFRAEAIDSTMAGGVVCEKHFRFGDLRTHEVSLPSDCTGIRGSNCIGFVGTIKADSC